MPRTHVVRWITFAICVVTCFVLLLHPADMDKAPPPPIVRFRAWAAILLSVFSPFLLPIPWVVRIAAAITLPIVVFGIVFVWVIGWSFYNGTFMEGVH